MGHRRGAGQRQAGNHGEDGGEGHRRDEAEEQAAADGMGQVHRDHVAAADDGAGRVAELRIGADHDDGTEADDDQQQVEVADETSGVEHALACFLGAADGEEAHQDMRQAGGAEHHADAEGNRVHRVRQQAARRHDRAALGVHGCGAGEHRLGAEAEVPEHHEGHEAGAREQQDRLDDLHPGGRQHAAEGHVADHQHAHQQHRVQVAHAEQQLDQLAGADHLRHQVHQRHGQGAEGRGDADRALRQAVGDHVGEGVLAEVAQAFGDQEQDDRPAGEYAEGIQQAVVAAHEHHRRDAEEGCCGHHVAGDRQAVLEAGESAAGGVEVARRAGAQGGPAGDAEGEQDEQQEHADGMPVERARAVGGEGEIGGEEAAQQQEQAGQNHFAHSCFSLSLSGSSTALVRCT
ncbi:hypothetical protein D3C78_608270 [compost metagenome]